MPAAADRDTANLAALGTCIYPAFSVCVLLSKETCAERREHNVV